MELAGAGDAPSDRFFGLHWFLTCHVTAFGDLALASLDAFVAGGAAALFHAVRAELLTSLGHHEQARAANERALALAANTAERELLARRLGL